jgi:predicted DsbA family dithiol-disulfide isomerase
MEKLNIEVTYDFICPWCLIGETKLREAINATAAREGTRLSFVAYELDPQMPLDGLDRKQYRSAKFGSWERSQTMDAHVADAGREVGLEFNYSLLARTPTTLSVNRLVWMLQQQHHVTSLVESIFSGHIFRRSRISETLQY